MQLCVNPAAGSWQRQRVAGLKAAFEASGARVIITPNSRGQVSIERDATHVCAVGGDGTVRHVVAAVSTLDPPPPVSIYPLGTVNLLARECGYTDDIDAFVGRVMAPVPPRRHYIARIGDTLMLTCASVGPDSAAIPLLSERLKQHLGRAAYGIAFSRLLVRWPRPKLRVVAGSRDVACEAVYVAKGRLFAGPWSFAPTASVDDPLLHVVALPRATRLAFFRFVCAVLRGREPGGVVRFTCSDLTIHGGEGSPVQADGDVVAHLPVAIRVSGATIPFA